MIHMKCKYFILWKKVKLFYAAVVIGAFRVKKEETRNDKTNTTSRVERKTSNSNIFLKPLFRSNFDPFVNNANLGAIAHTSIGT